MRKRAVVVGVNEYASQPQLRGCVNDGTNVGLVLAKFAGFTSDEIRVIADEAAAKSDIEEQIDWLVDGAQAGDLLFLHFSGHGSQVRDVDEQDEPRDHLDEILCPFDMAWDGTFITDDYLRRRLVVPAGVVLEVVLDACHTGDENAELGIPAPADATADRQPRFLVPPAEAVSGTDLPTTRLLRAPMEPRVALWSACGATQTAADARINGIFNGAFTFYFCKHLRESQGNLSRAELLRRIRKSLSEEHYTQVPELAAPPELLAAQPFHL